MNVPVTSARERIISPLPATGFIMSIMLFSSLGMRRDGFSSGFALLSERDASKRRYSSQTVSYMVFAASKGKSSSLRRTISMGSTAPLRQVSTRCAMPEAVSRSRERRQ